MVHQQKARRCWAFIIAPVMVLSILLNLSRLNSFGKVLIILVKAVIWMSGIGWLESEGMEIGWITFQIQ